MVHKIHETDVGFDPVKLAENDMLTPSTAKNLLVEFSTCPECDAPVSPPVGDGKAFDRDVVWDAEDTGSEYYTCDCGAELRILVEEKTTPTVHESIPDESWASLHTWITTDEGVVVSVNPANLYVSNVSV